MARRIIPGLISLLPQLVVMHYFLALDAELSYALKLPKTTTKRVKHRPTLLE